MKPLELLLLLVSIIILLFILDFKTKQDVATIGPGLAILENEIKETKKENLLLEEKILTAESMGVILEKAKQMGFREAEEKDYVYLR